MGLERARQLAYEAPRCCVRCCLCSPSQGVVRRPVEAIGRVGEIDRAACRAAVEARFTVDRMADRYLALYRELLG